MGSEYVVYDLDADLGKLSSFEAVWKTQHEKLSWAADVIHDAAKRVVGGEQWAGPAAGRYYMHQSRLVDDLDECADLAGKVSRALGECREILRFNQGLMTDAKEKVPLSVPRQALGKFLGIVPTRGAGVAFYPADAEQVEMVEDLVATYNDIRGRVDGKLDTQLGVVTAAIAQLARWKQTWSGLRILNYNIQQGGDGNTLRNEPGLPGTQPADLPALARRIIDGDVDIATVQEIWKGSAKTLEKELNRQAPDNRWEVHFGEASSKGRVAMLGAGSDFGNAVIVRTGTDPETGARLSTGPATVTDLGPGDEPRPATQVQVRVQRPQLFGPYVGG